MPRFSDRLRQLRTARDLSQMEFAKLLGISKSSINMYERGEREPGLETLENIADYFNVDMDYLLGKTDVVNRTQYQADITVMHPILSHSKEEAELLRKFRCLDARGRSAVLNVLEHEYASLPGDNTAPASKQA